MAFKAIVEKEKMLVPFPKMIVTLYDLDRNHHFLDNSFCRLQMLSIW